MSPINNYIVEGEKTISKKRKKKQKKEKQGECRHKRCARIKVLATFLKEILMAVTDHLPLERIADYEARMKAAQDDLQKTRSTKDLVGQIVKDFAETKGRESAKDEIHNTKHKELMAILEETNRINEEIIAILLAALQKQGGATTT